MTGENRHTADLVGPSLSDGGLNILLSLIKEKALL